MWRNNIKSYSNINIQTDQTISHSRNLLIPQYQIIEGLNFIKSFSYKNNDYKQTLTPKIGYLYTPYENQDNLLGKDKYQNLESEPGIVYITNLIEKIIKNLVVRCNVLDIYFNINQILNKTLNVSVNDITLKTQKSNFDNL